MPFLLTVCNDIFELNSDFSDFSVLCYVRNAVETLSKQVLDKHPQITRNKIEKRLGGSRMKTDANTDATIVKKVNLFAVQKKF